MYSYVAEAGGVYSSVQELLGKLVGIGIALWAHRFNSWMASSRVIRNILSNVYDIRLLGLKVAQLKSDISCMKEENYSKFSISAQYLNPIF